MGLSFLLKTQFKRLRKKNANSIIFLVAFLFATTTLANPVLDNVAAGQVTVQQPTPTSMVVTQTSDKAILNWQSFNIGSNESTHFQQPQNGIALNRISPTQGASEIYGRLSATGQIILVNPAGIYFGPNAYVDVGGMIATTAGISDNDFSNSIYHFVQSPDYPNATIINEGQIFAAQNGLIAILAPQVINHGLIQANLGTVVLGSGNAFTVNFDGNGLINFAVDEKTLNGGGIKNTGILSANGGTILVTARAAQNVLDNVINMSGYLEVKSVHEQDGEIILSGDPDAGVVQVAGDLNASGLGSGEMGGNVTILGHNILLDSLTLINTSGDIGGGNINIGGNYHGNGPLPNATSTIIAQNTLLTSDAITRGNGGNVIVWSNDLTKAYGSISAKGGALGGDGGFIETSGNDLDVSGIRINTLAPKGNAGNWLLDPYNVSIGSYTTSNLSFASGTYSPTGTAFLSTADLLSNLASSNVTVETGASGSDAGHIAVNDADLTWSAATTLTLNAAANIYLNTNIDAANGGLILNAGPGFAIGSGTLGDPGPPGDVIANIHVKHFKLESGNWSQIGPSNATFNVFDFRISDSGNAQFIRAYAGVGDGSTTPYEITDVYGLQGIGSNTTTLGYHYMLHNDIDASGTLNWDGGVSNEPIGFIPIGHIDYPFGFTGSLDGNNFTISSLHYDSNSSNAINLLTDQVGLFSIIGLGASVSNLNLNVDITGTSNYPHLVGGLAGENQGSINNVHVSGTVHGEGDRIGGLVAVNGGGIISFSSNSATVTGGGLSPLHVAGLVGLNGGSISDSYNTGHVSTSGAILGGLVGLNNGSGTISRSYNAGLVDSTGFSPAGGLVGYNSNIIEDSYNLGRVTADLTTPGGLVGTNAGSISNSYSIGPVINTSTPGAVGGLVGNDAGTTTTTGFYDSDFSGVSDGSPFQKTTAEMFQQSTYAGWDFATVWGMADGQSYPFLRSLSGDNARAISGTTPFGDNQTIRLVNNGASLSQTQTGANGFYYFLINENVIADNDALLLIYSAAGNIANTITLAPSTHGSITGLNLTSNTINIGDNNNNNISITTLATAKGTLSSDILYTISGDNLLLGGAELITSLNTTYNISGDISYLSGNGNMTFNGTTLVTLAPTINAGSGNIVFTNNINGADLILSSSGEIIFNAPADLASLVTTGGGLTRLNNNITTSGNQNYNNAVQLGSTPNLVSTSGDIFANTIDGGGNALIINNAGTTSSISGVISNLFYFIKTGVGTLTLSSANTYSGDSNLQGGNVIVATNTALGSGNINFANGSLSAASNDINLANNYSVFNSTPSIVGANDITLSGMGNLSGNLLINNTGTTSLTGDLWNVGGITMGASAGTLVLSGTNTYEGQTIVNGGVLSITAENNLGANPLAFTANQLILNGGTLQTSGTFSIDDLNRGITLGASGGTFNVASNGALTINDIIDGSGSLTKTGTGSLILDSNNTFSGGTTISDGILGVDNPNALGTSGITIDNNTLTLNAPTFSNAITLINGTLTVTGATNITSLINLGAGSNNQINANAATSLAAITGSGNLVLQGINDISLNGNLNISNLQAMTLLILADGTTITTSGSQSYDTGPSLAGALSLAGAATLTSTSGNISFLSTVIGGAGALNVSAPTINLNSTVTTTGNQSYQGALTFGSAVDLSFSGSLAINGAISTGGFVVNVIGNGANDNFALNTGSTQNWIITGADMGNVTVTAGPIINTINYSSNENLTGGAANDAFALQNGTLSGSINGGAGANTLSAQTNIANAFTITGVNAGGLTGIGGTFSNIQNLTGGNVGNTFTFSPGSMITGLLSGDSMGGSYLSNGALRNTLNYAGYGSAVNITLSDDSIYVGTAQDGSLATITNFSNINELVGNGNMSLTLSGKHKVTYDPGMTQKGYIDDPLYFDGFTIIQGSSPIYIDVSRIIQQPVTDDSDSKTGLTPEWVSNNYLVETNLDLLVKKLSMSMDADLSKVKIIPNCGG